MQLLAFGLRKSPVEGSPPHPFVAYIMMLFTLKHGRNVCVSFTENYLSFEIIERYRPP